MEVAVFFGPMLVIVLGLNTAQGQRCCSPDQWEGARSSVASSSKGEGGTLSSKISYIYYDNASQRLAIFTNLTDASGQLSSTETLVLYSAPNTGVWYEIDLETKKCAVQKIFFPFPKICIPGIYQKLADLTLGAANESLPVSLYRVPNETLERSITVTRNLCIPVSELATQEVNGEIFVEVTGYADIKLSISQPSVFTVPAECQSHVLLFEQRSAKFPRWHSWASPYPYL